MMQDSLSEEITPAPRRGVADVPEKIVPSATAAPPTSAEPTVAAVAAAAKTEEKKEGPEVLIVEDDTFLVRAYEVMLSSQGFNVKVVTDGNAAMEHLKEGKLPGVMLLDLMLPKLSGFEVLQKMQADTKLQKVPVIVLSNLGQPDDIARAKKFGAKDYFVKADTPLEKVVAVIGKFINNPAATSNLSEGSASVAPMTSVESATPLAPLAPTGAAVPPAPATPISSTPTEPTETPPSSSISSQPPPIIPNAPPATLETSVPPAEPPPIAPSQEPPIAPAT